MPEAVTKEQIATRRRHAEADLIRRGVLKSGFPPGLRMIMALFPRLKSPYHGDHIKYALILGMLFALPFIPLLAWLIASTGRSVWIGVAIALAAGLGFGAILAGFQSSVHRRLLLTPWDDLDSPAPEDVPEGAEDYKTVEGDLMRRMRRINRL